MLSDDYIQEMSKVELGSETTFVLLSCSMVILILEILFNAMEQIACRKRS